MVATTLLSEANDTLLDCDYERLRCYAGVASITKQSRPAAQPIHGTARRQEGEGCGARVSVQGLIAIVDRAVNPRMGYENKT
jgi:hypothetical protein